MRKTNLSVTGAGAGISTVLLIFVFVAYDWRQSALFAVGLSAGIVLYHAAFGFTSAWRDTIVHGRGAGLRAQMVMLGLTVVVFAPLITQGELWGISLRGSVNPLNLAVASGAFLFGLGMQLGGSCASGTLFTVGGGNTRMLITLAAFIAGSVIGAWHWPAWQGVIGLEPVSLLERFGLGTGVAASLAIIAVIWVASKAHENRYGVNAEATQERPIFNWLRGPWSLIVGAIGLCAINVATLVLAGRPWGVTSGFALWGSKLVSTIGVDVASWEYWQRPGNASALNDSIFANITSLMDFGIILGALVAAGLAGKFTPSWNISLRPALAAIIGGLLMGYGARIAYGCNIGAFFGGVASSSLSGWLWFFAAFTGSIVGVRLRPAFGMA